MGASDSCLETSICPPAFIPDQSYEIKFNKNLFLRHQRNEIQPFLNKWTQWDRTAEETSCSTCISQVRHSIPCKIRKSSVLILYILLCATARLRSGAAFTALRPSAVSIWKPVCSFVGNRKSFFLDAFPGFFSERRPRRRHASPSRLQREQNTIRIYFNQFLMLCFRALSWAMFHLDLTNSSAQI